MRHFSACKNWLVACLLLIAASPAFAIHQDPLTAHLPDLPVMPKAQWFWVGQHMALNGVPMSIKMFTYYGEKADVLEYYHSLWKTLGNGKSREDHLGEKYILGYELEGYYYTVQFEATSGVVKGKLVVTPTPLNYRGSKRTQLPIPPRSVIQSKVESLDSGRREETVSVNSRFGVSYVVDFYKQGLVGAGWKLFSDHGVEGDSAVLSFQRGGELLQLTVKGLQHNNSRESQFLINWIK